MTNAMNKDITLLQGDCLELMKGIEDASIDLILCDLPYGTVSCKWDVIIPFEKLWEQYRRIVKENAAIVLFGSQPFTSVLGSSAVDILRYGMVWEKGRPTNFPNAKRMPLKGFEDILVFYKKQPVYNPQGLVRIDKQVKNTGTKTRKGSLKENGDRTSVHNDLTKSDVYTQEFTNYPRGILKYTQDKVSLHPTQKPIDLCEYLVKTYTNEGMTVLDNCMGSGTTGVACVNTNRKFIGIEKDEGYFKIAEERIKQSMIEKDKE